MSEGVRRARHRVRELREMRGWTREELAVASGVSYPTLSRIEGGSYPSYGSLIQIADALDATLDEVTGRAVAGT